MSKDTFDRKEIKHLLDGPQLAQVRARVAEHLPLGEFGRGAVSSIYLDTRERSVIARSLERPLYKEKLRVRWYGACPLEDADAAFVELKKKLAGIVYKRRLQMTADQARSFLKGVPCADLAVEASGIVAEGAGPAHAPSAQRIQIARELDAARARMGDLIPSVLITCDRTSFGSDDEGGVRITFDEHLRAAGLFGGEGCHALIADDHAVMEVKCLGAYPLWLASALSMACVRPSSFSKYGRFYEACRRPQGAPLERTRREEVRYA